MAETIQWAATAATIIAAFVTAANLGTRITGYGFCVFLVGSLCWVASGVLTGQSPVIWNNAILTLLNIFGIWRWLGRQAQVEEGAERASRTSEAGPGDDLFPVSLLTKAKLSGPGKGQCVDAMAGAQSGRLHYLVVSEGGVAGVNETLHRADWDAVRICDGDVVVDRPLDQLPEVDRDQWPGR
jgi:hypothetical protein